MTKEKNAVWRFFASVKLALVTLFVLASASIIGTIIRQRQAPDHYVKEYGPELAGLFESLGLTDMYGSWWFVTLLALFAVNLVVCSIERIPAAWRIVRLDNLAADPAQLEKLGNTHRVEGSVPVATAADRLQQLLAAGGWGKVRRRERDGAILLFAQRGAWSRLGVYVVHLSILVIMAGAMLGNVLGFKAYVFLPEGRSTTNVFLQRSAESVPLGFELACDRFERSFYPNGMIREYRADLTVHDPQRAEPYHKSVIVNDPLSWRGITFYQADSYPLEEYFVVIRNQATGREQAFRVPAAQDVVWEGSTVTFRIDELQQDEAGVVGRARIRFSAGPAAEPAAFWVDNRGSVIVGGAGGAYSVSFRQLFSTLLLATKDPGVEVVWLGCTLMVIGLAMSFGFAHRRIWALVAPHRQGTRILVGGNSNKQRPVFERRFRELVERLEQDKALNARGKSK